MERYRADALPIDQIACGTDGSDARRDDIRLLAVRPQRIPNDGFDNGVSEWRKCFDRDGAVRA